MLGGMTSHTADPVPWPTMIGRELKHYRILDSLGKGGMGDVYMAEDTRLERRVAIKFLPFSVDRASEQQLRFIREAKAAARVNHTNIAQVYGFDEIEGRRSPQSSKKSRSEVWMRSSAGHVRWAKHWPRPTMKVSFIAISNRRTFW